jgi:hypothetical protein
MRFSTLVIKRFNREDEILVFETAEMLQDHVKDIVAREIEAIYESGHDYNPAEVVAIAEIADIMDRNTLNLVTLRAFTRDVIGPHASRKHGGLISFEFKHNQEFRTSQGVRMGQFLTLKNLTRSTRVYDGSPIQRFGYVITFDNAAGKFDPMYFQEFGDVQDNIKPEIRSHVGGCTISLRAVGASGNTALVATYDSDHDEWMRV